MLVVLKDFFSSFTSKTIDFRNPLRCHLKWKSYKTKVKIAIKCCYVAIVDNIYSTFLFNRGKLHNQRWLNIKEYFHFRPIFKKMNRHFVHQLFPYIILIGEHWLRSFLWRLNIPSDIKPTLKDAGLLWAGCSKTTWHQL